MSGITTGIGIFSGIDTASLISQLISIEARPKAAAQIRLTQLQGQQAAILDINTRLLNLGTAAKSLRIDNVFKAAKATSSNSDVLTASAGVNATLGSFNFIVNRLVSTHQQISRGFANEDTSGVGATEFTFEVGGGRVDSSTKLGELNGGLGVDRGKIEITDANGDTATIDLSTAVTINDVINTINSSSAIDVTASVDGYGLNIDNVQSISNAFGSETASSLGIAKTAVGNVIDGDQIHALNENTPLSLLRDGNGVSFLSDAGLATAAVADFIIDIDGTNYDITLGELSEEQPDPETGENEEVVIRNAAATLGDLFAIINEDTEGNVTAAVSADGTRIELNTGAGNITVEQGPTSRPTAEHLGLLGQPAGATVSSTRLLSNLNSTLVSNLNGGAGLSATDLTITTRDASVFNITLDADGSLTDLIETINADTGGAITAALNKTGNGIQLTDNTAGGGSLDVSGGAADDLNLTGTYTTGVAGSGNLQSRYISEATLLSSLNGGEGIGTGSFRITDSTGDVATINVGSTDKSIFDVLRKINNANVDVTARINDQGDGILIEDAAGGSLGLKIEDDSGRVARNLNLVGEGDPLGVNAVDGSFERTVTFEATDTLQQVANKINSAGVGVDASIINDGFGASPFRLVFTSETSGAIGRATVDTGDVDLGLSQLSAAQDSVVFFGSTNPADAVLLTSSSNTLDNVITGVTIDLASTSTQPVEVNITRDTAAIEESIESFVEAFNGVIDRIDFHGRFNQETEERGVLLGDGLLQNIQRSLQTTIQGNGTNVQSQYSFLFEAGISIGDGGKLEFDSEEFRAAFEEDPAGIAELFSGFTQEAVEPIEVAPGVTVANTEESFSKLGVLEVLAQLTERFTDSIDGVLTRRKETFDSQIQLQEGRISQFDVQLDQKRARLEQQFFAMEQALAQLQSQQAALGSLSAGIAG